MPTMTTKPATKVPSTSTTTTTSADPKVIDLDQTCPGAYMIRQFGHQWVIMLPVTMLADLTGKVSYTLRDGTKVTRDHLGEYVTKDGATWRNDKGTWAAVKLAPKPKDPNAPVKAKATTSSASKTAQLEAQVSDLTALVATLVASLQGGAK